MLRTLTFLLIATTFLATPALAQDLTKIAEKPTRSAIDEKPTGDDAIRLQIFLDEQRFGPGVIDGKPGDFTTMAVAAWNERFGYPVDSWKAVNKAARKAVRYVTATAIIPDIAKEWVNPTLPYDRAEQGKSKRLSYRSYLEFMAERYHCDEDFLRNINSQKNLNLLKTHDSILVPNVTPFRIEAIPNSRYEADDTMSNRHVVVDTRVKQCRIYEAAPVALIVAEPNSTTHKVATFKNRGLVASFPITPGRLEFIELGSWELRNMVTHPWWRYDQVFLDTGKRGPEEERINIPPGPNSPVGVIWNGTSKIGVGLHGTSDPETIGRARSSGCIRLTNWDAIRLPELIRPGATIEIR